MAQEKKYSYNKWIILYRFSTNIYEKQLYTPFLTSQIPKTKLNLALKVNIAEVNESHRLKHNGYKCAKCQVRRINKAKTLLQMTM